VNVCGIDFLHIFEPLTNTLTMEYTFRTNWSQDGAVQMVEFLQHRIEALASRNEFLEAENEVLKRTLINELQNG
jgi:hypothetical protein